MSHSCWTSPRAGSCRGGALLLILLAGLPFLTGCSREPGVATVTGEIKMPDGKPVPMGVIRFISQTPGNPFRSGAIDNGRYSVEALAGVNVVVIETSPAPPGETDLKRYVTIPAKYTDPASSDLRPDVTGPTFTYDIALKS